MTPENNPAEGILEPPRTGELIVNGRIGNKFAPGNQFSKGKGRPKGRQADITRDVRAAIAAAFDRVGGVDYLVRVAETNPAVFVALLAKGAMLGEKAPPPETGDGHIRVTVEYV